MAEFAGQTTTVDQSSGVYPACDRSGFPARIALTQIVNGETICTNMGPKPRSDLLVRKVGDELVVLDQMANRVHQLNAVASLVWELCDGNGSVSSIATQVKERYDVDGDEAERDVQNLLARFTDLGLLEMDRPRSDGL